MKSYTRKLICRASQWGALTSNGLFGPFFFDKMVNAQNYEEMLKMKLWPLLRDRQDINELLFQQDGAPPHYGLRVQQWLNDHFPSRWIGHRWPIEWPPRSPDLSPPDFFLWGELKELQTKNHCRFESCH